MFRSFTRSAGPLIQSAATGNPLASNTGAAAHAKLSLSSPRSQAFREESLRLPEACATCQYALVCRGGCRRDRVLHGDGPDLENLQCQAFQVFFEHAMPGLTAIADRERAAARTQPIS